MKNNKIWMTIGVLLFLSVLLVYVFSLDRPDAGDQRQTTTGSVLLKETATPTATAGITAPVASQSETPGMTTATHDATYSTTIQYSDLTSTTAPSGTAGTTGSANSTAGTEPVYPSISVPVTEPSASQSETQATTQSDGLQTDPNTSDSGYGPIVGGD